MDFFEHQAQAKAASQRLLLLFLLVCTVFILLINGLVYLFFEFEQARKGQGFVNYSMVNFIDWQISYAGFLTTLGSIVFISIGCLSRWFELRKGGNALAVKIGARSLGFASEDEVEHKLINVVEEMAIASGVSTPGIYVLDNERSINAFVAGYTIEDSALVVTRGLLTSMNRDELQAVVAHEFSHILHGDNRINIRLMVLIAGFFWVAEFGKELLITDRRAYRGGFWTTNRSHNRGGFVGGIPIMVVGYIGVFFGRLIRTAISRKREYLADASAVQFTRNPEALASALNVIRENSHQGYLKNARAEEISHMCISPSKKQSWFATHPPIEARINTIDSTFLKRHAARQRKEERKEKQKEQTQQIQQTTKSIYGADVSKLQTGANSHLSEVIGLVQPENLAYAMALHDQISYEYRRSLQDPHQAKITLLFLLLEKEPEQKKKQLAFILKHYSESKGYLNDLLLLSSDIPQRLALPLVELMLPLLKTLDEEEKKKLLSMVLKLTKWDGKLTLFEICIYSLLKDAFESEKVNRSMHYIKKIKLVAHEINVVICSLIHNSGGSEVEKQSLHTRMMQVLSVENTQWLRKEDISAKDLYLTLKKLKSLSPMLKRSLMDVCGDVVLHDGIVHSAEYETLRLMSLILACPMPMLPKAVAS